MANATGVPGSRIAENLAAGCARATPLMRSRCELKQAVLKNGTKRVTDTPDGITLEHILILTPELSDLRCLTSLTALPCALCDVP